MFVANAVGAELRRVRLEPVAGMTRAEICSIETVRNPKAVLVLCPGYNGDGAGMIQEREWREFAVRHKLGLVGISFASEWDAILASRGYYHVWHGSGQLLLDGVEKVFGKDLPLILFGFSGGAHFVSRFEEWKPGRVLAWCAYSAGWWDDPVKANANPPGLILCGGEDQDLGASLGYFKLGRAKGKPWLWVEVPKSGHSRDPNAETFARQYLAAAMAKGVSMNGIWVDIDREVQISQSAAEKVPSVSGWIPDKRLLVHWKEVSGQ